MQNEPSINPEYLKQLIESECRATTWISLEQAIKPFLIEPIVRLLRWPYANDPQDFPCWTVADFESKKPGMTIAYSIHGHAVSGNPWGIVMKSDSWFGRDDSWFASLEDAFINAGMWTEPLPEGYEIR